MSYIQNIPKDPIMLLSFINMKLRDNYPSLEDLCKSLDLNEGELCAKLEAADYIYDEKINQFSDKIIYNTHQEAK